MARRLDDDRNAVRLWLVPLASTVAASALSLLPLVAQAPVWPPLGLLMALAWRLLRPEMWGAWIALALGLADDLIVGAPLGSAMALWAIAFLGLDIADHRRLGRDPAVDWQLAAVAILFCCLATWGVARFMGGVGPLWLSIVQASFGILLYPAAARLCAKLDHWRLGGSAASTL